MSRFTDLFQEPAVVASDLTLEVETTQESVKVEKVVSEKLPVTPVAHKSTKKKPTVI